MNLIANINYSTDLAQITSRNVYFLYEFSELRLKWHLPIFLSGIERIAGLAS
jgi:hypothetical protein